MNPNEVNWDAPLTAWERFCIGAVILWPILAITALCTLFGSGCAYKGAKVVEGTDLAVGINFPAAEGVAQLQLLNYLSGFRLGVDRNAIMRVKYTTAETNSYFGCITTRSAKTVDAEVEPCESATDNRNDNTAGERGGAGLP